MCKLATHLLIFSLSCSIANANLCRRYGIFCKYNIDITITNNAGALVPPEAEARLLNAGRRWQGVIKNDVPDVATNTFLPTGAQCSLGGPTIPETIDDLHICAYFNPPDDFPPGVIGGAAPVALRGEGGIPAAGAPLPVYGIMFFNSAFTSDPRFYTTALHEIGHVIGLGTVWDGTTPPVQEGPFPLPCDYAVDSNASHFYQELSGCDTAVPVEKDFNHGPGDNSPGSDCSHWDEVCFGDELMTPRISAAAVLNPLSKVTIGSLEDIGYSVDYQAADKYKSENLDATCRCTRRRRLGEYTTMTAENRHAMTGKRKLSAAQDAARTAAFNYGVQVLLAGLFNDLFPTEWVSIAYLDPDNSDILFVIVRSEDVPPLFEEVVVPPPFDTAPP